MRGLRHALCLVFPRYCPLRVRYNAGRVSPIQPVCILKLLSGDAVILRSEPSSRAALMGEQPNPWDLLQPQDATSRHRTFAPLSCGSRLYLHPALFRERARGQRLIAAIDLSCDKVRYLTVLFRERTDQSLRGQTLYFARESTSHGIVPISNVHEMVGVHRYKLVLFAALFAQHTPNVEVPNLPVAVDARGRSACYPRGSFYPLSPDPSTRGPR